jgi:hypothetical protein
MFPLLRASPSFSIGQRDQATDGWMRTIAPPRDTASVFFHRSPRWSSPSSRPEHDLETCRLSMRPCDQEDIWSETVIASNRFRSRPPAACPSEADGRLCRNARLPDMCERPRANAKVALGMDRAPSFFTMSNSPLHDLTTQPVSFPRRIVCARVVASLFFVSTASLLPWPPLRPGLAPKSLASAAAPTPK